MDQLEIAHYSKKNKHEKARTKIFAYFEIFFFVRSIETDNWNHQSQLNTKQK